MSTDNYPRAKFMAQEASIEVTIYKRPNGAQEVINCRHIDPEDEAWFKKHGAKLSMEEMPAMGFACYADVGFTDPDGEPVEALEFSRERSCIETLHALRMRCEKMFADDSYGKPNQGEQQ